MYQSFFKTRSVDEQSESDPVEIVLRSLMEMRYVKPVHRCHHCYKIDCKAADKTNRRNLYAHHRSVRTK